MSEEEEEMQRAIRDALLAERPDFSTLPPRVAIYRRLVRNTLMDVVSKILPATRERMNALARNQFDDAFEKFLEARGPRTHYLRDVPRELVEWATPMWRDANVAPWLLDLARHELTWFLVASARDVPASPAEEVALDKALVLSPIARIERFGFAVHEEVREGAEPATRDVALCYCRDGAHEVGVLELDALSREFLACAEDLPLKEALSRACARANVPMNDDAIAAIARLLADLGARGALLGAAPKNS